MSPLPQTIHHHRSPNGRRFADDGDPEIVEVPAHDVPLSAPTKTQASKEVSRVPSGEMSSLAERIAKLTERVAALDQTQQRLHLSASKEPPGAEDRAEPEPAPAAAPPRPAPSPPIEEEVKTKTILTSTAKPQPPIAEEMKAVGTRCWHHIRSHSTRLPFHPAGAEPAERACGGAGADQPPLAGG